MKRVRRFSAKGHGFIRAARGPAAEDGFSRWGCSDDLEARGIGSAADAREIKTRLRHE